MSTKDLYARIPEETGWDVHQNFDASFRWEYEDGREKLLNLYDKGKRLQWDAAERIDWSQDLDPENPALLPDEVIPIFGSDVWRRLTEKERSKVRRHYQSWQLSQFLHGEQGALICTAKIVQQVPNVDAKFYAATQVMDEARHVEAFSRLLHEKYQLAYPINPYLKALIGDTLSESRWDFTYLGMQVLIEGVALAAFGLIRDQGKNPLAASVNAYVMQDEARHVAFGRLALRDYYPHLTQKERDEREEFAVEGCYLLRDRFLAQEVWETIGLPVAECAEHVDRSEMMKIYRTSLFTRIVPTMKEIGLWGPRIQKAYADMGVLGFADTDVEALSAHDEAVGESFDRQREIERVAAVGASVVGASNGALQ
jgi:P-aminobenzoate N-oxygenase AurF